VTSKVAVVYEADPFEARTGTEVVELLDGQEYELRAEVYGGIAPYTGVWMRDGEEIPQRISLPPALAEILREVDAVNRLAARAAFGDREALREVLETDPAMEGLDRLYCMDVADALIRLHADVLPRFRDGE
jgi:hypothetical protein